MFELSEHIARETRVSGSKKKISEGKTESCCKNIARCPAIFTGMSREMRTQMNDIVAFTYLLNKREYCEEEKERFGNHIYSSCERIISLFDNFLDYAIIDTGNSKSEPGICTPERIFEELFSEFREKLKRERQREVILVWENQVNNNARYLIDLTKLTRVIRNLFQVAVGNTKSGYIKVGYYFRDDNLTFYFHDSGQGFLKCREFLHSDDMDRSLLKYNDTFTAVNLTLTRNIVQIMNGSIWIESNGITGSRIYFSVPAKAVVNIEESVDKFTNTMSIF
jgi:signal transduction histidine kinase